MLLSIWVIAASIPASIAEAFVRAVTDGSNVGVMVSCAEAEPRRAIEAVAMGANFKNNLRVLLTADSVLKVEII